ncbi:MAG TPA: hypothetical protein PK239_06355 [Chitinophagales bacterium]|nr:hypothetical protein [Chitinophagales bacterium]
MNELIHKPANTAASAQTTGKPFIPPKRNAAGNADTFVAEKKENTHSQSVKMGNLILTEQNIAPILAKISTLEPDQKELTALQEESREIITAVLQYTKGTIALHIGSYNLYDNVVLSYGNIRTRIWEIKLLDKNLSDFEIFKKWVNQKGMGEGKRKGVSKNYMAPDYHNPLGTQTHDPLHWNQNNIDKFPRHLGRFENHSSIIKKLDRLMAKTLQIAKKLTTKLLVINITVSIIELVKSEDKWQTLKKLLVEWVTGIVVTTFSVAFISQMLALLGLSGMAIAFFVYLGAFILGLIAAYHIVNNVFGNPDEENKELIKMENQNPK